MNWIIASGAMFVSSIAYYLTIRLGQKRGLTVKEYMLINFPLPALVFFIMRVVNGGSFVIPLNIALLILFDAVILEYFGASLSYKAIKAAPNAGYSLVIQKSYAVFTSIAAIFLFNSPLPIWKFGAIIITIFFAGLISLDIKTAKKSKGNWFLLSLIPFLFFGSTTLVGKYVVMQGVDLVVYIFWLFFLMSIISLIQYFREKNKLKLSIEHGKTLACIGIFGTCFYYFKHVAQVTAPNVGYVGAINVASNAFVALFVALLYKEHMSWVKFAAVVGVVVGVICIIL